MKKLLSGNEAFAWGAYHAGVRVAAAYPGTPSTEILESIARFEDVYAEWSTNEKVAMEVGLGAAYAGVRVLVSMKQVGLNVAMDPFMAASTTGIDGGMVVISADDPGTHSSQNEQDNRHYARLAKVPVLEPSDSQEAYDIMAHAFEISERFDTPVMVRTTTRISHSKSIVDITGERVAGRPAAFKHNLAKYVMLPVHARLRHPIIEERLVKLAAYGVTSPLNRVEMGERALGIVTGGIAYQYAREVFPQASFLKLGMSYPLPEALIRDFAGKVDRLMVIEELDPFLQESIQAMGLKVTGKEFIPRMGELDPDVVAGGARQAGLIPAVTARDRVDLSSLPKRPPLLCPGCPHTGIFYVLSSIGQRLKLPGAKDKAGREPKLIIAGDIGCYTLGAYPPLNAMDTTACMGASIGQALGMAKAGIGRDRVVAVIGDSTFLHSGITPLVNAVYNQGEITVLILDNSTTAMTGHQEHPGTGVSAQGKPAGSVRIEEVVRGIGVKNVTVVDAFNLRDLRAAVRSSLDTPGLSVIVVRGDCAAHVKRRSTPSVVDAEQCNQCGTCLLIGCPAIQSENDQVRIDPGLCYGQSCAVCHQLCPRHAIGESEGAVIVS
jgi:indolepyruvate ferredoxin oxidoreductase alpha subunit